MTKCIDEPKKVAISIFDEQKGLLEAHYMNFEILQRME